ncbi:hypothetical protein ABZS66_45585 [Dactylosporangium sp. NPDC005572]|uniref:hypothetical protein n=1 Tax=Dactylosporangium sp. NPDC005572 TaxID=3156889 RepID=UPI0033B3682D
MLREAYEQWCQDSDEVPVNAKRLTQRLQQLGVATARGGKGVRRYLGISLLETGSRPVQDEVGRVGCSASPDEHGSHLQAGVVDRAV